MRRILFFLCLMTMLGLGACGLVNLDALTGKDKDDNLLFLLAAALFSQSASCQNQSGLVICIPPGVPL